MKQLILTLLLMILVAACAPADGGADQPGAGPDQPVVSPTQSIGNPNEPPVIDAPTPPLKLDDTIPRPADKNLRRENVYVESTDLLTMESYPPQFMLVVAGNLPTPCNQLRVDVHPPDAKNKIVVDVYSVIAPDTVCAEVLQPFSQNIPLGSFPSGHYEVWVNGEKAAELDA